MPVQLKISSRNCKGHIYLNMIASKNAACVMGSRKSKLFLTNLLLVSVLRVVNTVVADVHEEAFRAQLYVEYHFSEASLSPL